MEDVKLKRAMRIEVRALPRLRVTTEDDRCPFVRTMLVKIRAGRIVRREGVLALGWHHAQ